MDSEYFSPLTVAKRLGALCLGVMMLYTFGWTAFIAQHEVRTGNHPDLESAAIATANGVGQVATLIVIYSIATTVALDILGGVIMVTARYLENKFVKPLIERHKAEGRVEGREEGIAVGKVEGMTEGIAVGRVEGREEGIAVGKVEGITAGIAVGEVRGREEGEAAERRRWTEWNSRRIEAERAGVSFDEPPPAS